MENIAIYALTRQGAQKAVRLGEFFPKATLFLPARLCAEFGSQAFGKLGEALAENFPKFPGHVVVGATGMVVRLIAPLIITKKDDPAVVTVGHDGRFAISLLSGHLGGANQLAARVAGALGGQAVISTATDIEDCPAIEVLARDLDMEIEDFAQLPPVSRALVEGRRVNLYDPHLYLAPHLEPWPDMFDINGAGEARIRVDFRTAPEDGAALTLRPKAIVLGLGCHRGIEVGEVEDLIARSLAEAKLSPKSIAILATVETRANEPAFLEISRRLKRPLTIFTKAELAPVSTPNPSDKVLERIGVPSVCEAAALLAAQAKTLLISKRKSARATLAAARKTLIYEA